MEIYVIQTAVHSRGRWGIVFVSKADRQQKKQFELQDEDFPELLKYFGVLSESDLKGKEVTLADLSIEEFMDQFVN